MNKWFMLIGGGLVSAIISTIINGDWVFNPVPGISFGILILLTLNSIYNFSSSPIRRVVFVLCSIAAYIAAFWSAIYASFIPLFDSRGLDWGPSEAGINFGIAVGGFVGALILVISIKYLFKIFSWFQVLSSAAIGAGLGLIGALYMESGQGIWKEFIEYVPDSELFFPSIFLIWQMGMIILMDYFFEQSKKQTAALNINNNVRI